MSELVYDPDLKSGARKGLRVRLPPGPLTLIIMEKFIIILAAFVLCFAASHYAYIVGRYGRKRWLDRIVFKILFTFKAKNFKEYFKELAIYTSKPNF